MFPVRPRPRHRLLSAVIVLIALLIVGGSLRDKRQRLEPRSNLHVVEIPLGPDIEIRPVLAAGRISRSETFSDMVERLHPYAAINGTFYSEQLAPLGDILIDGKLAIRGKYPNAFAVRKNGKAEFVRRVGDRFDWSGYKCAVAAGPRLVHHGTIKLTPLADGFRQMSLVIEAPRSGIGLTKSGSLLLVVCDRPVRLPDFAMMMKDLGAVEAMNLDGGPACGLYHKGKILVNARLAMTNLLLVYKRGQ